MLSDLNTTGLFLALWPVWEPVAEADTGMQWLGKVSWAAKSFLWQFKYLFQAAAQSSSMGKWGKMGKVGLASTASGANAVFENHEMHATGSFCSRQFWG